MFRRAEKRIPLEIPVFLESPRARREAEITFTEDVSARGARVVSARPWKKGEPLTLVSRTGEFRSTARVAYCQALYGEGYAIGVEFLEPSGRWVVESRNSSAQRRSGREERSE